MILGILENQKMLQIQENAKTIKATFKNQGKNFVMELNPKFDTEYLIKTSNNFTVREASVFPNFNSNINTDPNPNLKIQINLKNTNQKINLKLIASLKNKENLNLEIIINHIEKETKSNTKIKLATKNQSKINFIGTIKIQKEADSSEADLSIKSLILSKNSKISAKPNLEIENKKTTCSHGASISGINKNEVEYLMQRGLSKSKSKEIILESFLK